MIEPDWDLARGVVVAGLAPLAIERVSVRECVGRVLALDVVALTELPPFASSAMDGWAVCGVGPWRLLGSSRAGVQWTGELTPGTAVEIATGAVLPATATAVLRSEHGHVTDGELVGEVEPGKDMRPAGEEARAGEVLIARGTRISPAAVGLIVSAGYDEVEVHRVVRARILVFGDELLDSGVPSGGFVRDSLGPQLPAWLSRMGVDTVSVTRVEDTLRAHEQALESARDVDVVLTTGGTAHGPVDYLHQAIENIGGRLLVDSVAVRPGHPMLAAALSASTRLVGLPGNPQSAIVALLSLAAPIISTLDGSGVTTLPLVELATDTTAPQHETRLVASSLIDGRATPAAHLASHMLRGLASADGFAVVPPGGAAAGTTVRWLAFP